MNTISTLSLKWKLLSAFGCLSAIILGMGLFSNWSVTQLHEEIEFIGHDQVYALENTLSIKQLLTEISLEMQVFLNPESSHEERELAIQRIAVIREEYSSINKALVELLEHEDEKAMFKAYMDCIDPWKVANNAIIEGNTKLVDNDILDPVFLMKQLEGFKGDHYIGITRAVSNVEELTEFSGGADHTACRFGKWLLTEHGDNTTINHVVDEAAKPHTAYHVAVKKIQDLIKSEDQSAARSVVIEELLPLGDEIVSHIDELIEEVENLENTYNEMARINTEEAKPWQTKALSALDDLVADREFETDQQVDKAVAFAGKMENATIGVMVICILGAISFGYLFGNSLSRRLQNIAERIGSGSMETRSAASQVATSSSALAEGASEQAASLEETSSSMEEMTSMVSRNADLANATMEQAMGANESVQSGVNSMKDLREGVDAAGQSASELSEAMEAIRQSSDNISKIIKTIDEIAFQTNILALNAAVEAARAGEAGAGFAVVADEVRSLARRAADAANETQSLIEDSVQRSERGVTVNQHVNDRLNDVLKLAGVVDESLTQIAQMGAGVGQSMDELKSSSTEQLDGISQINTAITQVNEVTQANAASAEEAASASEELNAQAEMLSEVVNELTRLVQGKMDNAGNVVINSESAPMMEQRSSEPDLNFDFGSYNGNGNGRTVQPSANGVDQETFLVSR